MSFRLRVTLLTAAAVAVAAIGASVAMYFVVQDQLMHQVEANLQVAAQNAARGGPGPGDGRRGFGPFEIEIPENGGIGTVVRCRKLYPKSTIVPFGPHKH